jgi:hypothetical protein
MRNSAAGGKTGAYLRQGIDRRSIFDQIAWFWSREKFDSN